MGVLGNNAILGSSAAGAYEIEKSLRFNYNDNAKLTRQPSSATKSSGKGTFSLWVKISGIYNATNGGVILGGNTSGNTSMLQLFKYGNQNNMHDIYFGNSTHWISTQAYVNDYSAWYHICCIWDTPQGTQTNRMQIWINGVRQAIDTGLVSWPNQNDSFDYLNDTYTYYLGKRNANDMNLRGYLSEIHFVDGTAKVATDFAEINEDTGQWVPKKYIGSYGTNGFYLNFKDNSGTTATTLGKDSSGNGNNWTPSNLAVTGVDTDSYSDTPTNNFPILNRNQTRSPNDDRMYNGGLSIDWQGSHDNASTVGTFGMKTGKWYFEVKNRTDNAGQGAAIIGIFPDSYMDAKICINTNSWPGFASGSGVGFNGVNQTYVAGSNTGAYGGNWAENDIIGVAVDADAGKVALSKNGQWSDGSGNYDESGIIANAQKTIGGNAPYFLGLSDTSASHDPKYTVNFGQTPFSYTIPTGYKKLCSQNLPEPTILKPSDHFKTVLYTGTGSDKVISDVGFQSDLVWIKNRTQNGNWHDLYDSIRGATKRLFPNEEDPEQTQSEGLKAFSATGFTVGSNSDVGTNGHEYVAWCWKKSATAGFDIQTYTGNALVGGGGANNQTISHDLGVPPELILIKAKTAPYSGGGHWIVYHKDLNTPTHNFLKLNTADGTITSSTAVFNQTAPTSSVFSVGLEYDTNKENIQYMAYLWASVEGFSKIGKYKGNGVADGPFVYTGFRPAFVMMKATNGNNWAIFDSKRDFDNGMTERLHPNLDIATNSGAGETINFFSNGFRITTNDSLENPSGHDVVYFAIAETAFKYSNAR